MKAIKNNGKPSLINIDQNGAITATLKEVNRVVKKRIKIRQCKNLHNMIEQDHAPLRKKRAQC